MTQYLPYISIIVVIAIVAFVIERRWRTGKETETAKSVQKTNGRLTKLRDKVTRRKQKELPKKFQAWAAKMLTEEQGLKDWLTALSPEEAQSFTKQVAAFCADLNLDLSWLVERQLDKDPELEQTASSVVVFYCLSCQQAAQAQGDFKAFDAFQSLLQKPSNKVKRTLSQKLFAELVKQEMAPAISPEFFLAPEKERQAYMMESIQKAADADRSKFNDILKQVMGIIQEEKDKTESLSAKMLKPFKRSKSAAEDQPVAA